MEDLVSKRLILMEQKYVTVKLVGSGAFGNAYLVRRKDDGTDFVAKEARFGEMPEQQRRAAINEVAVLSELEHPNITKYVDCYADNSVLYLVMEYAEQGDLWSLVKANKRKNQHFAEGLIMQWFVQICSAICYLHDRHILHRDLKARNIFLTAGGRPKVGDFGLCKVLGSTMGQAHTVCGTPYYMAPEMCMNQPYDNRTDIWSLGCVLYELAALQHAFEGRPIHALLRRIVAGNYAPLSARLYSAEFSDLVRTMLQVDPAKRPGICGVLRHSFVGKHMSAFVATVPDEETREVYEDLMESLDEKPDTVFGDTC
eukprot:TRINITY_DN2934_c0_g1_i1.p1 TRINITY_DN2934_c0_g1~~TRINITY_DN2934_c0_g1_i1.p1  ORF type:complete len:313 (-),score=49.23 TRINITY_DN2934_c0_g1_i1:102-1040(-)